MPTTMKAPAGTTSCSFDGREYKADRAGRVSVPDQAAEALRSHGFKSMIEVEADEAIAAEEERKRREAAEEERKRLEAEQGKGKK